MRSDIVPFRQKIVLFFVSLGILFVILEIIIRMLNLAPDFIDRIEVIQLVDNPKIGYKLTPGFAYDDSMVNRQGYKDDDFTLKKKSNVVRIAMFGDSITEGFYVALRKTFPNILEQRLNEWAIERRQKTRYEVMNFGVSAYNMEAEVETLRTEALKYAPDIVIFNFYYNDAEPLLGGLVYFLSKIKDKQLRWFIEKKYYGPASRIKCFFMGRFFFQSKLYLFIIYRMRMLVDKIAGLCKRDCQKEAHDHSQFMNIIAPQLDYIKSLQKKHGFKLLFCMQPFLNGSEHENNIKMAHLLKIKQIPFFSMLTYYSRYLKSVEQIKHVSHPRDLTHPNELGHSIIADAFFNELKKRHCL